jgi:hypothetical protein
MLCGVAWVRECNPNMQMRVAISITNQTLSQCFSTASAWANFACVGSLSVSDAQPDGLCGVAQRVGVGGSALFANDSSE